MTTEIVKMSSKGQLVVPDDIREQEKFRPGDRFVPMPVKDGVVFRKIEIPDVRSQFAQLTKELSRKFRDEKVTAKTVKEAVQWARRQ